MTELNQVYKCEVCGNITEVVHASSGQLSCCGQPMKLLEENTVDAALEKHVPVLEKQDNGKTIVKVGSVEHPMEPGHYIEFIEIICDLGSYKYFLKPGDKPEVIFYLGDTKDFTARAYCNLHGLWKSE
jgi:superoxide reductase